MKTISSLICLLTALLATSPTQAVDRRCHVSISNFSENYSGFTFDMSLADIGRAAAEEDLRIARNLLDESAIADIYQATKEAVLGVRGLPKGELGILTINFPNEGTVESPFHSHLGEIPGWGYFLWVSKEPRENTLFMLASAWDPAKVFGYKGLELAIAENNELKFPIQLPAAGFPSDLNASLQDVSMSFNGGVPMGSILSPDPIAPRSIVATSFIESPLDFQRRKSADIIGKKAGIETNTPFSTTPLETLAEERFGKSGPKAPFLNAMEKLLARVQNPDVVPSVARFWVANKDSELEGEAISLNKMRQDLFNKGLLTHPSTPAAKPKPSSDIVFCLEFNIEIGITYAYCFISPQNLPVKK